jgi:hypothetical protein
LDKMSHAMEKYTSLLDVPQPPMTHIHENDSGDLTFEDKFRAHEFVGGVLKKGDVLRVQGWHNVLQTELVKFVEVSSVFIH